MDANRKRSVTGWVISIMISLSFFMSGGMKFVGGPQAAEVFNHFEIPQSILMPLGVIELACVILYLIPITSVIGAILTTGFVGGIIVTHWRVGDPVYIPIVLGLMVWMGLYLREPLLRKLIPLNR